MNVIDCNVSHAEAILTIFNDAILNSTALYEYKPRTLAMMAAWFEARQRGNFPIIGVTAPDGQLVGFGTYASFRAFPAYKYTVEHSLYIAAPYRGRGLGKLLLKEIVSRARSQGYHVLIGAIDSENKASVVLHERMGFKRVATMPQVGFKFGRWLDLLFYQLVLDTPGHPIDG